MLARRLRHALPLVVLGVAVGGLVAGCGSGATAEGASVVATATVRLADAVAVQTYYTITAKETGTDDGVLHSLEAEAATDGQSLQGTMILSTERIPVLLVDETYYLGYPDLPDGVDWVQVPFDELADGGLAAVAAEGIPLDRALALLAAIGSVEEVGRLDVDGEFMDEYRAVVTPEGLRRKAVPRDLARQIRQVMGDELVLHLLIDDDGLIREMIYEIDLADASDPPPELPAAAVIRYVLRFGDYSRSYVPPAAPPPGTVMSVADHRAAGGGAATEPVGQPQPPPEGGAAAPSE